MMLGHIVSPFHFVLMSVVCPSGRKHFPAARLILQLQAILRW
jgi:hypothetical protein